MTAHPSDGAALRDEAEALARAVELGACATRDAVAWADAAIARDEAPHWTLCDVALARPRHPQDLAALLRQVPGTPQRDRILSLVLSLLRVRFAGGSLDAGRVAAILHRIAVSDSIDDPGLDRVAWWASEALDLADQGYLRETRDDVVASMRAALDSCADAIAARGVAWGAAGWQPA